jgi:ABC-2 type transport system permease protein
MYGLNGRLRIAARLRAALAVAQITWKEWAAYRAHMAVSLLTGPLRFLVMAWIWRSSMDGNARVAGLGRDDLATYSGLAVLTGYLLFDFADWNLQMLVRTGRYANYLLLPQAHIFFAFSQKLGHRFLALLLEVVPVWGLISWYLGRPLVPRQPAWFALSLILGFLLLFLINYGSGLLGFWMTRTEGVRRCLMVLRDTLGGAYLPLSFFPAAAQPALFLLPYAWALYVPASVGLGHIEIAGATVGPGQAIACQAAMTAATLVAVLGLRRLALKRFMAAGG